MEAPLVIMPRGWTPDAQVREGRDRHGKRVKLVTKTDQRSGLVSGNSYGPGYEAHRADGRVAVRVRPLPVAVTVHASDLGMNVKQLRDFWLEMEQRFPKPKPSSGLLIAGG